MFNSNARNREKLVASIKADTAAVVTELERIAARHAAGNDAVRAAVKLSQGVLAMMERRLDNGLSLHKDEARAGDAFKLAYSTYLEIERCIRMAGDGAKGDNAALRALSDLRRRLGPIDTAFKDLRAS